MFPVLICSASFCGESPCEAYRSPRLLLPWHGFAGFLHDYDNGDDGIYPSCGVLGKLIVEDGAKTEGGSDLFGLGEWILGGWL